MELVWERVESSSSAVSHPLILRARLPHGWLVASQVHGGYSIVFVPDVQGDKDWSRERSATPSTKG